MFGLILMADFSLIVVLIKQKKEANWRLIQFRASKYIRN